MHPSFIAVVLAVLFTACANDPGPNVAATPDSFEADAADAVTPEADATTPLLDADDSKDAPDGTEDLPVDDTTEQVTDTQAPFDSAAASDTAGDVAMVDAAPSDTSPEAEGSEGEDSTAPSDTEETEETVDTALSEAVTTLIATVHGLDLMSHSFPLEEVDAQTDTYPGPVDFLTALDRALVSFLTDDDDIESPLGIASLVAEGWWDPAIPQAESFEAYCKVVLLEHLNLPSASLTLVPMGGFAEHGESVTDAWIFHLTIDALSDHLYWAIVDREGVSSTYNYGFN